MFEEKDWNSGSNIKVDFATIKKIILDNVSKGARLYIGSDSYIARKKVCFATALCLHSSITNGRYFFYKEYVKLNQMRGLVKQ